MANIIIWVIILAAFIIAEAATAQLVSIWFVAGSAVSLIISIFQGPVWLQVAAFIIVSGLTLIFTRPIVRKLKVKEEPKLNNDRHIGKVAVVTKEINNTKSEGSVKLEGMDWSARSDSGAVIPQGESVTVLRIEGVKLIVTAVSQ